MRFSALFPLVLALCACEHSAELVAPSPGADDVRRIVRQNDGTVVVNVKLHPRAEPSEFSAEWDGYDITPQFEIRQREAIGVFSSDFHWHTLTLSAPMKPQKPFDVTSQRYQINVLADPEKTTVH